MAQQAMQIIVGASLARAGLANDGVERVVLRQKFASDVAGLLVRGSSP